MSFGFSFVGAIMLAMLFVPNIFWSRNMPRGYEDYCKRENKILLCFERAGQVSVSCLRLIFKDFDRVHPIALRVVFGLMLLYEGYWVKYFKSEKRMADMYTHFLGIPLAGASLPVRAFGLLGVFRKNLPLIAAVTALGIGHIGIHFGHYKEIKGE